ncbi:MFS transporter [Agarivorans sp. QJM3NY_25]|uniref:MFS transporter n=1 Tax=Agarivorans sp. QJM3NY_25 TaxID=3421430 RepID=UPI003D7F13EA
MLKTKHPWIMLASIYITQYIGIAFILSAAMAILRQQGVPLDKLALLNLAVLPMVGKIFYAPLIDKYKLSLQGKYRSWLILSNLGMVLLLLIIGTMDASQGFLGILGVIGLYVFFMSLQDVSVDGLSCKLFSMSERKFASSVQFSGNLLGNIIGGGLLLIFYPWLGWQGSFGVLAGLTALALIQVCLFKEPNTTNNVSQENHQYLFKDINGFMVKHKSWFVVLALYPFVSTWGFALLNPILVDGAWSLDEIGSSIKIFGSIVGVFSAMLAAPLITKLGRQKALISALVLQMAGLCLIILPAFGYTDKVTVYLAIVTHFVSFPALLVISSTIFMDNASVTSRKATFFTLQASFASLLGFVYSWLSMAVAKQLGYGMTSLLGAVISLIIVGLVWILLYRQGPDTRLQLDNQCN